MVGVPPSLNFLVVDDEPHVLDLVKKYLSKHSYLNCSLHQTPEGALDWARGNHFDIAIIDYKMPKLDGLELLNRLKVHHPDSLYILMTAYAELGIAVGAIRAGAFDFITKPFEAQEFDLAVDRYLRHLKLKEQNYILRGLLHDKYGKGQFIGHSKQMKTIKEKINLFAKSSAPVLVTGETGVGKEIAARMTHSLSSRKNFPFVAINCTAYAETLLESELFGHEKGAFTGADRLRIGKLELAKEGTILLDEVAEVPPHLQVKLLRVLQEKEFERVGGNVLIKMKARIITSTNRNIGEEIRSGRFRQDLYYRLNTLQLHIPPLRERKQDVSLLVQHFLQKFSLIHNKEITSMSDEVLALFHDYPWPGNVRELENAIDYAVLSCDGSQITKSHLPVDVLSEEVLPESEQEPARADPARFDNIPALISNMEREKILTSLEGARWNKSKAAANLGLTRAQLLYRLKKYEIT